MMKQSLYFVLVCSLFVTITVSGALALPRLQAWALVNDKPPLDHSTEFVLPVWGSSSDAVKALYTIAPVNDDMQVSKINGTSMLSYALQYKTFPIVAGYYFIEDQVVMTLILVVYNTGDPIELVHARYAVLHEKLTEMYGEPSQSTESGSQWLTETLSILHMKQISEERNVTHFVKFITQKPALQTLIRSLLPKETD